MKNDKVLKFFIQRIPQYRKSPELFAQEVCKFECDQWQKEVFADIAEFPKVTVRSGQGVGKTGCEAVLRTVGLRIPLKPLLRIFTM